MRKAVRRNMRKEKAEQQKTSTKRTGNGKSTHLRVATININGINELSKRLSLETWANKNDIDIVCISGIQFDYRNDEHLTLLLEAARQNEF